MWDVFISHAWEDKDTVVRPLAGALLKAGLKIWYDEFTLKLGDSLRRSINCGLAKSKYGIVILSPHFFDKEWPQRELDGLVVREISSRKPIILPVWHNIDREYIERFSPILADKLGVSTAKGLDIVVEEILNVIRPGLSSISVTKESQFVLLNRADASLVIERFDKAVYDAALALLVDPKNTYALRIRAEAYTCLHQFDKTIKDATDALEIEPKNPSVLRIRAKAFVNLHQFDKAIKDATDALRIEPRSIYALTIRAEAYRRLHQFDKAIKDATDALRIEPWYTSALRIRARALMSLRQFDKAILMLRIL